MGLRLSFIIQVFNWAQKFFSKLNFVFQSLKKLQPVVMGYISNSFCLYFRADEGNKFCMRKTYTDLVKEGEKQVILV